MTGTTDVQADHRELLFQGHAAYNSQDVEALLALVGDEVDWPDDDGGRLPGKAEVRTYWTEQWARTRTHDEPVSFDQLTDGRTAVHISQVVRSLDGSQRLRDKSPSDAPMQWKMARDALGCRELLVWTGREVRALSELRGRGAPGQPEWQRRAVQLIGSDAQQREGPAGRKPNAACRNRNAPSASW